MPEQLPAIVLAVAIIAVREWARVQLARERRREREQELWAGLVTELVGGQRPHRIHHHGTGESRPRSRDRVAGECAAPTDELPAKTRRRR